MAGARLHGVGVPARVSSSAWSRPAWSSRRSSSSGGAGVAGAVTEFKTFPSCRETSCTPRSRWCGSCRWRSWWWLIVAAVVEEVAESEGSAVSGDAWLDRSRTGWNDARATFRSLPSPPWRTPPRAMDRACRLPGRRDGPLGVLSHHVGRHRLVGLIELIGVLARTSGPSLQRFAYPPVRPTPPRGHDPCCAEVFVLLNLGYVIVGPVASTISAPDWMTTITYVRTATGERAVARLRWTR